MVWELLRAELRNASELKIRATAGKGSQQVSDRHLDTLVRQTPEGKSLARAVLVDSEPKAVFLRPLDVGLILAFLNLNPCHFYVKIQFQQWLSKRSLFLGFFKKVISGV